MGVETTLLTTQNLADMRVLIIKHILQVLFLKSGRLSWGTFSRLFGALDRHGVRDRLVVQHFDHDVKVVGM